MGQTKEHSHYLYKLFFDDPNFIFVILFVMDTKKRIVSYRLLFILGSLVTIVAIVLRLMGTIDPWIVVSAFVATSAAYVLAAFNVGIVKEREGKCPRW